MQNIVIDVHTHIFNNHYVPRAFRERYSKGIEPKAVSNFLNVFDKWLDEDDLLKEVNMLLQIGECESIQKVTDILIDEGKKSTVAKNVIYVPLMMDMQYGVLNPYDYTQLPENSFEDQVQQNMKVALANPGVILPFIAADPRRIKAHKDRKNANDPFGIKYLTDALEHKGFWGVKIYPPLGYEPYYPYLMPLYDYCQAHKIPITAHAYFAGSYAEIDEKKAVSKDALKHLANPAKWEPVLELFPELIVNFGHFGGDLVGKDMDSPIAKIYKVQEEIEHEWRDTIVRLMQNFKNVYADISYNYAMFTKSYNEFYFKTLSNHIYNDKIGGRIMFGSDWWLSRYFLQEGKFIDEFQNYMQRAGLNDYFSNFTYENAAHFLGLDNQENPVFKNYLIFLEKNDAQLPEWFSKTFIKKAV